MVEQGLHQLPLHRGPGKTSSNYMDLYITHRNLRCFLNKPENNTHSLRANTPQSHRTEHHLKLIPAGHHRPWFTGGWVYPPGLIRFHSPRICRRVTRARTAAGPGMTGSAREASFG